MKLATIVTSITLCTALLLADAESSSLITPPFPEKCVVHIVEVDGTEHRALPCADASNADDDDLVWIEAGGFISSTVTAASKILVAGTIGGPKSLVQSAHVTLLPSTLGEGEHAAILSMVGSSPESLLFFRPVAQLELDATLTVPVGRVLAVIFDQNGDVTGLSRIVTLGPQAKATLEITAPDDAGAFAMLASEGMLRELSVSLEAEAPVAPEWMGRDFDRVVAIWPVVDERRAVLRASADEAVLHPVEVSFRPGRISTVKADLIPRPAVDVAVTLPPETEDSTEFDQLILRISRLGSESPLREVASEPKTITRIANLPLEPLEVQLTAGGMRFRRRIDLTSGQDTRVTFDLEPLRISGTVFVGDEPTAAELHFVRDGIAPVRTDQQGRYEVTLWEPGPALVRISAFGMPATPFSELLRITRTEEVDFHIPSAKALVIVTDERTGHPIPDAVVGMASMWLDESGSKRRATQTVRSDTEGKASLPPLRSGSLELMVTSPGYANSETVETEIRPEHDLTIPIVLRRTDESDQLTISLPDGSPAAGALALILAGRDAPLMSAAADQEGNLALPKEATGHLLLIRHEKAGGFASVVESGASRRIQLPLAAPPLTVRVVSGNDSVVAGGVYVWINRFRLTGSALSFLTGTSSVVAADGSWRGANLPVGPLRILITRLPPAQIESGSYDVLATTIPFPWPAVPEIPIAR